jgi:endonuclease YncB( thermonuclease family)
VEIGATKIRLVGIDAPETDQLCIDKNGGSWPCGVTARDELVRHVGSQPWSCLVTAKDRYGRSLARCESGGEDIEKWMVRNGWALSFVRYSHVYDKEEGEDVYGGRHTDQIGTPGIGLISLTGNELMSCREGCRDPL